MSLGAGMAAGLLPALGLTRRAPRWGARNGAGSMSEPRTVLRLVLGRGIRTSIAGVVLGVMAAAAFTRILGGFLYEVEPDDPMALLGAGAALVIVSSLACLVPARRATGVDPARVLSEE